MAEVVYLVPDVFNSGKLVASATPPLDGDPFNPPRPHNLLLASAGMWKAGRRPAQEDDDGGDEWIEVIFDRPEPGGRDFT